MSKIVVGNYLDPMDAEKKVSELITKGYPRDSISLIASKSAAKQLDGIGVEIEHDFDYIDNVNDESLWMKIKNFFGYDTTKYDDANVRAYSDSIRNGDVLVIVDEAYIPAEDIVETGYDRDYEAVRDTDDETIRLKAERLNVDKTAVQSGEAVIRKRVVENMETVQVPVRHEEVIIERTPVADGAVDRADFDEETITIPVMKEEVVVSKRPVVTEEIHVHKREIEENQRVSETLRSEKLDVKETGAVNVVDDTRV